MPEDQDERLAQIKADLAYFRTTLGGGQPSTLYAAKYVEDVECLLGVIKVLRGIQGPGSTPSSVQKTDVETALEHDEAGRVERKPKRT
jgi:hypothetical protein